MSENMRDEILASYKKKVLFTSHALNQMNLSERLILREEVTEVLLNGKIVEEYLDDPRGKSCLICGKSKSGRIIHIVCAPKKDYLAIITAYIPTLDKWDKNFNTRRK